MLFELWKWVKELLVDIITFDVRHWKYDVTNIYWFLRYGFTFSDIQDLDAYMSNKLADTLEQFNKHVLGSKSELAARVAYLKDLEKLKFLARYCASPEFEDLPELEQQALRGEFLEKYAKLYFSLWF